MEFWRGTAAFFNSYKQADTCWTLSSRHDGNLERLPRLGSYLARAHDPPPGNTVIWSGLTRLTDIELGIMIGVQLVGN
jgi:hypothetical protein